MLGPSEWLFSCKVDSHRKADSTETQATLRVSVRIRVSQAFYVSGFTGDDSPKTTEDGNSNNQQHEESANKECR